MLHRPHIVFDTHIQSALSQYIVDLFVDEHPAQRHITEKTTDQGLPQIDLRAEEGWMVMLLTRLIHARRAVEIGTLAGYSATWIARGLPEDGKLISLEVDEHHASVARENLKAAGLASKVEVIVGNAHETLRTLRGPFDLAFLDADKPGYDAYLTWALANVRPGGLIMAHNVFSHGSVVDGGNAQASRENAEAIKAFNQRVASESRLLATIIPVGDGLLMAMVLEE
jgi:caffeoyl-CoA O-methyltransferase